jgi:serine/threonine-protein phosphatase 6 regulatory ankyrin repeat subunit B
LLAKGVDVNTKNKYGVTALMLAAESGHTEIVQLLLANGAAVNDKDIHSKTPLMCAEESGNTETVQALLAKGAEVNPKNRDWIALIDAARNGDTKTLNSSPDLYTGFLRACGRSP